MVCVSPFTGVSQFIKFLFVKCNYLYITLSLVIVHTVHTVILQYICCHMDTFSLCVCVYTSVLTSHPHDTSHCLYL